MGEKKRLRSLIWKNEQFNKSVDKFIKEIMKRDKLEEEQNVQNTDDDSLSSELQS